MKCLFKRVAGQIKRNYGKGQTPAFALRDYGLASQSARDGRRRRAIPTYLGMGALRVDLNQIVKKVGTPRRRCPKHQARRAVSEI